MKNENSWDQYFEWKHENSSKFSLYAKREKEASPNEKSTSQGGYIIKRKTWMMKKNPVEAKKTDF